MTDCTTCRHFWFTGCDGFCVARARFERADDGTSQIEQWILDPRKMLLSEYLALPIREDRPPDSEDEPWKGAA